MRSAVPLLCLLTMLSGCQKTIMYAFRGPSSEWHEISPSNDPERNTFRLALVVWVHELSEEENCEPEARTVCGTVARNLGLRGFEVTTSPHVAHSLELRVRHEVVRNSSMNYVSSTELYMMDGARQLASSGVSGGVFGDDDNLWSQLLQAQARDAVLLLLKGGEETNDGIGATGGGVVGIISKWSGCDLDDTHCLETTPAPPAFRGSSPVGHDRTGLPPRFPSEGRQAADRWAETNEETNSWLRATEQVLKQEQAKQQARNRPSANWSGSRAGSWEDSASGDSGDSSSTSDSLDSSGGSSDSASASLDSASSSPDSASAGSSSAGSSSDSASTDSSSAGSGYDGSSGEASGSSDSSSGAAASSSASSNSTGATSSGRIGPLDGLYITVTPNPKPPEFIPPPPPVKRPSPPIPTYDPTPKKTAPICEPGHACAKRM